MLQFAMVLQATISHTVRHRTLLFRLHSLDNERIKSLDGELLAVVLYLQFAFVFEVGVLDVVDQPAKTKTERR